MANLSVDEFLDKQGQSILKATVELVDNDPASVKITPWASGIGCPCQFGIKVQKSVIDSVVPTGETHLCCGKQLQIVEVHFSTGGTLPAHDVFSQLAASVAALKSEAHSVHASAPFSGTIRVESGCPFGCPPGTECCYSPSTGRYCCKADCRVGPAC